MAQIDIDGIGIGYQWVGEEGAPPVVITPGGRYPRDTPGMPQLAETIAASGRRVLLWDRPGCGDSDISFAGDSESAQHVDVLVKLLRALGTGPVAMLGGSAGSRISLLAAAQVPEHVSHLILWWISGGPISLAQLAAYYCGDNAIAAARGGMEAVAKLPGWAEQIARNPRNRDIIMAQEPEAFIARMQRWAAAYAYSESSPVPGMAATDFARLTMPVHVFRSGASDMSHTRRTSEWVQQSIPHAHLVEPPWPDQEWNNASLIPNAPGRGRFERWPLLAPQIVAFLDGGRA
ncbi:alpha/beta fold hydrolase [Sphingobium sufflavum]|uniref:alpha/beta fold hydrolase n=1 Tax=Sphingobium sufflavum TaxID=1129547 RepID=UPI001F3EF360|nr:alpha/beta fold hydrolase [Sphingobium sufflavum]MCE7795245.1 alpha/beta fold hydrolase [Sphingobium sufflavum]